MFVLELEDWDFIATNDCASNIRWLNVDNRSIIATVKQRPSKTLSTLNRAISKFEKVHFENDEKYRNDSFRLDVRRT